MRFVIAAALALTQASPLAAQIVPDFAAATPIAGRWSYAPTVDGSEALFSDASANPQLWLHCFRASRRVTIGKAAAVAAPFMAVWTSSLTRSVPSSFNPATGRLTIELGASDPLLDAIIGSRGRVGFLVGKQPPLIVPPWAEAARVIEDCRA